MSITPSPPLQGDLQTQLLGGEDVAPFPLRQDDRAEPVGAAAGDQAVRRVGGPTGKHFGKSQEKRDGRKVEAERISISVLHPPAFSVVSLSCLMLYHIITFIQITYCTKPYCFRYWSGSILSFS